MYKTLVAFSWDKTQESQFQHNHQDIFLNMKTMYLNSSVDMVPASQALFPYCSSGRCSSNMDTPA